MKPLRIAAFALLALGAATTAATDAVIPFAEQAQPPAPDYRNAQSWAALPEAPGASQVTPAGASAATGERDVDVFYIHPTTDTSASRWNQPLDDAAVNAWTDASVIARQASVFNACCRVYAPRYRQATVLAVRAAAPGGDGNLAYDLAYSDVLRAFDDYIANRNQGRPFVIAGHSQGGLLAYRLLRDRVDSTALQQQLVVAYVVGLDLMEGDFGRTYHSLQLCSTPDQTGCVAGWNTVNGEADIALYGSMAGARYAAQYQTDEGRTGVCVNPLTFSADQPQAPASASLGAVPGAPDASAPQALKAGLVSAKCTGGYLVVEADPALDLQPLPGGSMHFHDIGLFYADIRQNVARRIAAFGSAGK
ncbi:DUF3089 domain-containing protein [Haliea sp. E17]|uniref:DUF3089 domain-containing protein n=1 Tax=Haliea sp. E17 TaxID=3401576 RepID=UPI003AAFBC9C